MCTQDRTSSANTPRLAGGITEGPGGIARGAPAANPGSEWMLPLPPVVEAPTTEVELDSGRFTSGVAGGVIGIGRGGRGDG